MGPVARILPCGERLHLQHGPIDLIIGADGDRDRAFRAAQARFSTLLQELVDELPMLRRQLTPDSQIPEGLVARRMQAATYPHAGVFVTRMAAVAGAVADEVLAAMRQSAELTRAYVNNGGDIALHLTQGTRFKAAMRHHDGRDLGHLSVAAEDGVRGIATSARHGRSLSLGIADSVSVLVGSAAEADVAATLIANAVDLPRHPAIQRKPACELVEDSDLGMQPVVVSCGLLCPRDADTALQAGLRRAAEMRASGLIADAVVFLQDACATTSDHPFQITMREPAYV